MVKTILVLNVLNTKRCVFEYFKHFFLALKDFIIEKGFEIRFKLFLLIELWLVGLKFQFLLFSHLMVELDHHLLDLLDFMSCEINVFCVWQVKKIAIIKRFNHLQAHLFYFFLFLFKQLNFLCLTLGFPLLKFISNIHVSPF